MHFPLVPLHLHLGPEPVVAPLVLAHMWVVPLVGLLLLLPLHGMLPLPVLVHLPWEDAAPPDVHLVLAQLALDAPLLCVGTASVVLDLGLLVGGPGAASPGAGVADVEVDSLDVLLPATSQAKALVAMFALEGPDLVMYGLDVCGEVPLLCKLHSTLGTLEVLHSSMNLEMPVHVTFLGKPLPTLGTLVLDTLVRLLVKVQCLDSGVTLATLVDIALESLHLGMN